MQIKKSSLAWGSLFLLTFLAAYLYTFNEWLFAITKPYFMNDLALPRQLQILFTISALVAGACFLGLVLLWLLSRIPALQPYEPWLIRLGALLPAGIFATLILIMVDNFTYTVFKWGIVSTAGWIRASYGLGFLIAFILCYRSVLRSLSRMGRRNRIWGMRPTWLFSGLGVLFILSIALLALPDQTRAASIPVTGGADVEQKPHILLITADGVNADHMSVYGYGRETTPRLKEIAESALVAENAFANSGNSPGSIVSLYTGKYPAQTRLLYPPDILTGTDAYEHLPALLRAQGYRTVQITFPHYLDASTLNVADGFDEVKMNTAVPSKLLNRLGTLMPSDHALFADETLKRLIDRTRHIFLVKEMENPYLLVTGMHARRVDIERWVFLRQEIETAQQPLFVHVHLMVTHGMDFFPMEQKFSAGQSMEDQGPWEDDFYDDSIFDFDTNVGALVDELRSLGLLENTILVIGSDHGQKWDPLQRLPLIIRFPDGGHAGTIRANVQNLDIAPTLLDYIGLEQPAWMRGTSLLAGELEQRPIFSASIINEEADPSKPIVVDRTKAVPPFEHFGDVTLIYCQNWYRLDLMSKAWESGEVEGSTAACSAEEQISDEQARAMIVEHLRENGFDVSSLESLSP